MNDHQDDVDEQDAAELPDREAMTILPAGVLTGPLPPIPAVEGAPNDQLPTTGQGMNERLPKI
jgi:hypothetical protein